MRIISYAAAITLSISPLAHGAAGDKPVKLCSPFGQKQAYFKLANRQKKTVASLLNLDASQITASERADSAAADATVASRVRAMLNFRPRSVTTLPVWAERVVLTNQSLTVGLRQWDGKIMRMEIEGFYACVEDAAGRVWFYRAGPTDGWPIGN